MESSARSSFFLAWDSIMPRRFLPRSSAPPEIWLSSCSTISSGDPASSSISVSFPTLSETTRCDPIMAPFASHESVTVPYGVFTFCESAWGSPANTSTAERSAASVFAARSRHALTPRFQALRRSVSMRFTRRPFATCIMAGLLCIAAFTDSSHDLPTSSAKSCSCGGLFFTSASASRFTRSRVSRTPLASATAAPGLRPTPALNPVLSASDTSWRRMSRTCSRVSGVKRRFSAALAPSSVVLVSAAMPSLSRIWAIFSGDTPSFVSAWMNASLTATARFGSISTPLRDLKVTWWLTFLRPVTSPLLLVVKSICPALYSPLDSVRKSLRVIAISFDSFLLCFLGKRFSTVSTRFCRKGY